MPAKAAKSARRKGSWKQTPTHVATLASPHPPPVKRVVRTLPVKSLARAAYAFKKFSLSRVPKNAAPTNYVSHLESSSPSAVSAMQREVMAAQVKTLAKSPPETPGMSLALPQELIAKLLPSLNEKAGTVATPELLDALRQAMRGTEFYASGNATLNRVVRDARVLSQVQALIASIKRGV
jgi:hypothetical protein